MFKVCLKLFDADGEIAFPSSSLNLATFRSKHGLCKSAMINKRTTVSHTARAVLSAPWTIWNPDVTLLTLITVTVG